MRDYIQPVRDYATAFVSYLSDLRIAMIKHRTYTIAIAAVFFVAMIAQILVLKNTATSKTQTNDAVTNAAQAATRASLDSTEGEQTEPANDGGGTVNSDQTNGSNTSSQSNADVTVNNQQIPVPENGSVSKTVQSSDGSTTIDVTSNNASNGDSQSSNSTSTSLNVSTKTNSRNSTTVQIDRSTTH